jgi:CheY-like chemotaxis protein
MERQIAHMSHLLDDLLDISRITHGTLDLKRTPTDLGLVVATAIETARPMLDAKHHTFTLELPKQPVPLAADAVRLSQVFANLLINAAKYTDPGGHIQLRALQERNEIVVRIRDDGIGIPAQTMPRLFRLFSQGHTEPGRKEGGLGVGLALVRGLVTLHGGNVDAASEGTGRGSEFTVRLPVVLSRQERSAKEVAVDSPDTGPGLNVLVVDDNRDSADTCAMLLELSGHHVRTAYTARGALELGARFHPDALLLDIGLPDLDGYELAQSIRATPWGHAAVLVAITGWGQDEDRRRALEAGFDHHLTKPIVPERLESLLQSLPRVCAP